MSNCLGQQWHSSHPRPSCALKIPKKLCAQTEALSQGPCSQLRPPPTHTVPHAHPCMLHVPTHAIAQHADHRETLPADRHLTVQEVHVAGALPAQHQLSYQGPRGPWPGQSCKWLENDFGGRRRCSDESVTAKAQRRHKTKVTIPAPYYLLPLINSTCHRLFKHYCVRTRSRHAIDLQKWRDSASRCRA